MSQSPFPTPPPDPPPAPGAAGVVPYAGTALPSAGLSARELYGQVPRLRRDSFNSSLTLLALAAWLATPCVAGVGASLRLGFVALLFPIALVLASGVSLLVVCVIVLTGPVYYPKFDRDGRLKTWGLANKIVAALLLVICLVTGLAVSAAVMRHLRL